MCTELLRPGGYSIAVNEYIILYRIKILCAFLIALKRNVGNINNKNKLYPGFALVLPFFRQLVCMVLHYSIIGG
jgi:hypothetical protein